MTIWTIQPVSALEQLEQTGVYRCAREKSFNLTKPDSLEKPYRWLMDRMRERIGPPPSGVESPVWAWHTWEFQRQCPDPESAAFLRRTEEKVLLTLDVPQASLVLTDFDAWQNVLMDSFVSDAATAEAFDALERRLDALEGEALQAEIRRSWDHVFLTDPVDNEFLTRGKYIQATFWEIRQDHVRDTVLLPKNG